MKKYMTLAFFAAFSLSLSGCSSTLDGAGRDIEKMGQKIQKTF